MKCHGRVMANLTPPHLTCNPPDVRLLLRMQSSCPMIPRVPPVDYPRRDRGRAFFGTATALALVLAGALGAKLIDTAPAIAATAPTAAGFPGHRLLRR